MFGTEIIVANGHSNEKLDSEEIINEIITLIHCFSLRTRLKKARKTRNRGAKCSPSEKN